MGQDGAESLKLLDQSLKYLEKAIELNPKLPEARFNRALALQALFSTEQAKQAWRDYLLLDTNSPWAEEARRNLQILEEQKNQERSADELERDFLGALRDKSDEKAWLLLSQNRELIKGKYLPQRLAMSYLAASDSEKEPLLYALQYAGELEQQRNGDLFAKDIAHFYLTVPKSKIESLKQAQTAMQNGYRFCLQLNYEAALSEFNNARNLFKRVDNIWEAKLSEYFIGYCLINNNRPKEALAEFQNVAEFSESQNYKWLKMTSLHWIGGSLRILNQRTGSKKSYQEALAIAEEINDSYAVQRNLSELTRYHSFVGQNQMALSYLHRILKESADGESSLRQKYRNYDEALKTLTAAKFYNAAKPIAKEVVLLADRLGDRMFETLSRCNAGIAYVQTGDYDAARTLLNEGREIASEISDELTQKKMFAYISLKSGYLERQAGNYEKSEQFYDEALQVYETIEIPSNLYEAQKGKLLAYQALGKRAELERQIPATLKLIEDYREKILEEQERTSFFDSEESIYDIAVRFNYEGGRYEQAYNYAEISSSRSLLDWLQKGAEVSGNPENIEILLKEKAPPLGLSEIREQMPEGVQILQYSVLENEVLIWLISKETFAVNHVKIRSGELREKVDNYVKLLKRRNEADRSDFKQLSEELYGLLISPVLDQLNPNQVICLIPSKVLFNLPFAALTSGSGKSFLVDFSLIYAPSANEFLFCSKNALEKSNFASETLLSIGNPAFSSRNFDLPNLPTAEREAQEIGAFYEKAQIFLGRQATKKALLNAVNDADIIHFAGHYVVIPNTPLSSYLLLAQNGEDSEESLLTNSELVGERLGRAKLIVLSACQTGVEDYSSGEGLIGLSRTFLAAGAPLVVASQWSVDTEATAALMKRFHSYRRQEKLTTVAALRKAQLTMLNEPDGRFRDPYYWAAFAVFGGYAAY
ncbi:MAG TPA: CHAT domain-containing protein [Pyrinomonadaceae bacterium]